MSKTSLLRPVMFSMLIATASAQVEASEPAFRVAMMDMMPMGGGTMQQTAPAPAGAAAPAMPGVPGSSGTQAAPAPGGGGMGGMGGDDMMRMGTMPVQGPSSMPAGQMAQQPSQQPMAPCPMMGMMQNMMRMGAAQQGMPMPGAGSGSAMGMDGMAGAQSTGSSEARLEGRIAFLRTELRITSAQVPAWDTFAAALRAGREHLDAARAALQDSVQGADPMARLESYESHLKARTEAIHMTRMAFATLFSQLDDAQKRMATTTMLPFIGSF